MAAGESIQHEAAPTLTHLRADGSAHMVDVSGKPETTRTAVAGSVLRTTAAVRDAVMAGNLPKGDALAVARIAGIMAAKQTPALIPLCHPLPLAKITVDFTPRDDDAVAIEALVTTRGVTGVEMEALTAVSVAALTLYDMIKAVDKGATIEHTRVLAKSGGKSGDWTR
ncbi:molybdenum cofactor biosynthesis protein C [Tersicoccus phoenicis]|uniref:Cyclic pyranopterin monophosphate synthase n=1 Tax=Tersicoccus phoenicis TaxID=554083 RepID=A0A1R1LB65_9MICC|nr:cyclic pyranopterin monophosphate synthase MoaC [Tersicoccus phoenicis]OMH24790.1 molybdenum cofactor biosynthesis protein C [Tersicoccus phoenicis]